MQGQMFSLHFTRALERDSVSEIFLTTLPGTIPSLVTYSLGQRQQQYSTANIQGTHLERGSQWFKSLLQ